MAAPLFFCRYYVGHKGRFGHEFSARKFARSVAPRSRTLSPNAQPLAPLPVEFEFSEEVGGAFRLRYANGSEYKNESKSDVYIRKETRVHRSVVDEVKRFIAESSVLAADDAQWPEPDSNGLQELEITLGRDAIFFNCAKIGALSDIKNAKDPKTLTAFYYLVQDLKCLVFSLISVHFKIKRALERARHLPARAAPTESPSHPQSLSLSLSRSAGLKHGGAIEKRWVFFRSS